MATLLDDPFVVRPTNTHCRVCNEPLGDRVATPDPESTDPEVLIHLRCFYELKPKR